MDEEMEVLKRMDVITSEYAQLKQMANFDLTLEAQPGGCVKATVVNQKRAMDVAEIVIKPHESLDFITDTFLYPNTFTPRSKNISLDGLQRVYFDRYGYLIAIHDNSTEQFKVSKEHREEVTKRLSEELGDIFKGTIMTDQVQEPKKVEKRETVLRYKIYFTLNGKEDWFIVEGDTFDKIKLTASDLIIQRGLDINLNNVYSENLTNK